jgi:hypothetical protein
MNQNQQMPKPNSMKMQILRQRANIIQQVKASLKEEKQRYKGVFSAVPDRLSLF